MAAKYARARPLTPEEDILGDLEPIGTPLRDYGYGAHDHHAEELCGTCAAAPCVCGLPEGLCAACLEEFAERRRRYKEGRGQGHLWGDEEGAVQGRLWGDEEEAAH